MNLLSSPASKTADRLSKMNAIRTQAEVDLASVTEDYRKCIELLTLEDGQDDKPLLKAKRAREDAADKLTIASALALAAEKAHADALQTAQNAANKRLLQILKKASDARRAALESLEQPITEMKKRRENLAQSCSEFREALNECRTLIPKEDFNNLTAGSIPETLHSEMQHYVNHQLTGISGELFPGNHLKNYAEYSRDLDQYLDRVLQRLA